MKLFVSWSGEDSREVAEIFKDWLPTVIQEVDVWVSSQDIGKGEKWSSSLWESLSELEFGLLAVTRSNATAPWIMFEAGALSKTVKSRVIPILCGIERLDVGGTPLAQFQNALATKEEIFQVMTAINSHCANPLPESRLRVTFERWWPDFEQAFSKVKFDNGPKTTAAKTENARLDKIEAALESVLGTLQRMRRENREVQTASVPTTPPTWGDLARHWENGVVGNVRPDELIRWAKEFQNQQRKPDSSK